ncbi:MAG: Fic family protein, partial [Clostridia bacterium]|nr:Fic family protein [Clostridia bacterium]
DYLRKYHGDEFIIEFTDLYCELNHLHPFREGNGRVQRLFLSMLVSNLGMKLDFSEIDADLLMIATIKSVSGEIFMLRDIFREHIKQASI